LAAIRQLFDYLVTGGALVSTPAGSVRGPKDMVTADATIAPTTITALTMEIISKPLAAVIAAVILLVLMNGAGQAEISPRDRQALAQAELVFVATIRKNGTQSKAAPVWFTTDAANQAILIETEHNTWKAKRIRRGSPVLIWIGAPRGPAFIGTAEIINNSALIDKLLKDYKEKYWQDRMFGWGPSRGVFTSGDELAIKITPVRDLPDGFISAPGTPPPPLHAPPAK
jgi:general stress protein 26